MSSDYTPSMSEAWESCPTYFRSAGKRTECGKGSVGSGRSGRRSGKGRDVRDEHRVRGTPLASSDSIVFKTKVFKECSMLRDCSQVVKLRSKLENSLT